MGTAPTKTTQNGEPPQWTEGRLEVGQPKSITAVVLSNYIWKEKQTLRGGRKTSCYHHKRNVSPGSSCHPSCIYPFLFLVHNPFSNPPSSENTGLVNFGFLNGGSGGWFCVEAPTAAFPSGPRPRGSRHLNGPQMPGATKETAQCGGLGRPGIYPKFMINTCKMTSLRPPSRCLGTILGQARIHKTQTKPSKVLSLLIMYTIILYPP